jgi:GMP synthase (glutamine-hydrolysing)
MSNDVGSTKDHHRSRPQIAILDFGSQYTHLIARRIREMNVYCELHNCAISPTELTCHGTRPIVGIILSGGPNSVYEDDAPHVHTELWDLVKTNNIPLLGICYGMQELAHVFGGKVDPSSHHEYGKATVTRTAGCNSTLFTNLPNEFDMWMSHGDKLTQVPLGFKAVGKCYIYIMVSFIIYIMFHSPFSPSLSHTHTHCLEFLTHIICMNTMEKNKRSWDVECIICCN